MSGDVTVLADPQFSIVRVLRPFANFETVYNGQSVAIPINMTEDGVALDQNAGQQGYSPSLIRGIETPLGSRVILWLPTTAFVESTDPTVLGPYRWQFLWRYRNTFDFRQNRKPYHFPKQGVGAADSTVAPPAARVVIPAANNTITYIQSEPATALARAVQNVRSEDLNFGTVNNLAPLLPDGTAGTIQQGIGDPATFSGANSPIFQVHEMQALGDELLLSVMRDGSAVANWNFATTDLLLSQLFGAGPDVGVYVSVGAAP